MTERGQGTRAGRPVHGYADKMQAENEGPWGWRANTGEIGDIYTLPPKLWLVRNEVGGWTAMYPEDY